MIYYTLAPRFIFFAEWSHPPEKQAVLYFTFTSRPSPMQVEIAKSGLVLQTFIAKTYCPTRPKPDDDYEPPTNPIEVIFNSTDWRVRTPIPPTNSPGATAFAFGNKGRYSVETNFLEDGGKEIWRLNSAGKLFCQYFQVNYIFPKTREITYQGERVISNMWEKYRDMGFPQLLWRSVFSYKEHNNIISPPSLLALLPYKDNSNIYLFEYPNTNIADAPLGKLLSVEVVLQRDEDVKYMNIDIGHIFSQTILLNLFYRSWDFFGPYTFTLPCPEGIWILTISKSLKDKRRIEKKTAGGKPWLYDVINLPIWEYSAKWYLNGALQKEKTIPKMSGTSFIWFAYPYLTLQGELGVYIFELDYLPQLMGKSSEFGEAIYLYSGRKLVYSAGSGKVPDPSNLLFFPPRDYPVFLNYMSETFRYYYLLTHPQIKHRRFTQCYSLIPPYPSVPIGRTSPGVVYNWHFTGNFTMLGWDREGNWQAYDYTGIPISEGAEEVSLPPPNILKKHLGKPIQDCVFLSYLLRPEMPEAILFWFTPEDPNFPHIFNAYLQHLYSVLVNYPNSKPTFPWEFCLNPRSPLPIVWGELKLLIWRRGKGVVREKSLGRYPIQYLFPAIEKHTGYVYLPILEAMEEDGKGRFKLLIFKRNDWDMEVRDLI